MARERRKKAVLPRVKQLLLAVVLLASCDGTVYHRFQPVDSSGWSAGDTLTFLYEGGNEAVTAVANVAFAVQLRYAADYKYKNLCARVETLKADGELLSIDTLCCAMYDDNGHRLGSTAGLMYQNESEEVVVPASCADTLLFRVSHIMDDDTIAGLFDVGLKLSIAKE